MIHEVLLALSGHPSPLFDDGNNAQSSQLPLLSASERSLLQTLGGLSRLHRKLKAQSAYIAASHPSIICRAVAVSVQHDHLAEFQQKILDVESRILKRDSSLVGAYEIVPLVSIVSEFDEWHRLMEWYWDLICFVFPPLENSNPRISLTCTGSKIIDRLRTEAQTGYPSIEQAATHLSRVAEAAWLKQLSAWVVYGRLPTVAAQDFFVQADEGDSVPSFKKQKHLIPTFVSQNTANAILLIGRSIHHVEHHRRQSHISVTLETVDQADVTAAHTDQLVALSLPVLQWQFSKAIAEIRASLSRNVLQHLLPKALTAKAISCLRQFFLLHRGEFSISLITEAENRLHARQQSIGRLLQQDPVKAFRGLTIKEAELNQTLSQTWKALFVQGQGDDDEVLDFARENVRLSIPAPNDARPSSADSGGNALPDISTVSFNNLLFPTPTKLSLNLTSPLDLFLSRQELDAYSSIHSYLLAIRRAHLKLSDLWRRSPARRAHPLPSASEPSIRERMNRRMTAMRRVWATCSASIFLLAETAAFFEGEIIQCSCQHFQAWIDHPPEPPPPPSETSPVPESQRDPESLASAHRSFLASLTYALLLTDLAYTKCLRSLLGNVDQLIAFFGRLLDVQQKLDTERAAGKDSPHTAEDELRMALELDRARKKVDTDLKAVIHRLRQLDRERVGAARYLDVGGQVEDGGYEPWKGGGVERLLMKLEFGRMTANEAGGDVA